MKRNISAYTFGGKACKIASRALANRCLHGGKRIRCTCTVMFSRREGSWVGGGGTADWQKATRVAKAIGECFVRSYVRG